MKVKSYLVHIISKFFSIFISLHKIYLLVMEGFYHGSASFLQKLLILSAKEKLYRGINLLYIFIFNFISLSLRTNKSAVINSEIKVSKK